MKEPRKQEVVNFEDEKMRKVSKPEYTFLELESVRGIQIFTPDTISAIFLATGVQPLETTELQGMTRWTEGRIAWIADNDQNCYLPVRSRELGI